MPETGADTSPATIQGDVTTTDADSAATGADIALSALQRATPDGGSEVALTIPQFGASTGTVNTEANGCPTTKCASYTLIVPASNPKVGTFNAAGTPTLTQRVLRSLMRFTPGPLSRTAPRNRIATLRASLPISWM